jgi:uncharacterized SAM-binding protein YcdF (DUF218 family)
MDNEVNCAVGIIVLGCRVKLKGGSLTGELGRRTARAIGLYGASANPNTWLIMSGGVAWQGILEADAMRHEATRLGIPEARILCERISKTTRGNARAVRALLATHNMLELPLRLVTSDWHMQRALARFQYERLAPIPVAATGGPVSIGSVLRERLARVKERGLDWYLGPPSDV